MVSHSLNRKLRINKILNTIQKATAEGVPILSEKIIALMSLEWGLSKRYAQEYLDCLIDAGKVKLINKNELWTIEEELTEQEESILTS